MRFFLEAQSQARGHEQHAAGSIEPLRCSESPNGARLSFFFFSLKAQHTHQPDLRADQHVRHPCSQPEGGLQPSRKETWESSVSVIQLAPFRLPVKTPTAADQSQLLQRGSDVDVKPRSTGATTQMLIITALIEFT